MRTTRGSARIGGGVLAAMAVLVMAVVVVPLTRTDSAVAAAGEPIATPSAITLNWIQWTNPGSFPFNATFSGTPYTYAKQINGSITLPNGSTAYVKFNGEAVGSASASGFGVAGSTYWSGRSDTAGGTVFTSTNVPSLPNNGDRIGVAGASTTGGVADQVLSFYSDAGMTVPATVSNIVMVVWSLGRPGVTGEWAMSQDFDILSDNRPPKSTRSGLTRTVSGSTYNLSGQEGAGTIQFVGDFTSISWSILRPEYYAVWNFGVTSATPPSVPSITPSASAVNGDTESAITPVTFADANIAGDLTYTVKSGTLPPGLELNPVTGEITGTPTEPGDFEVVIEATGSDSGSATATVSFSILGPAPVVTFDANGGSGTMEAQSSRSATGLTPNAFTRDGYTFTGWNTDENGEGDAYDDGGSYGFAESTKLYAQWSANSYEVTFDSRGGSSVPPGSFRTGGPVTLPPAPTRAGYEFVGWFLAEDGGDPLADGYVPTAPGELTLYAQWREIPPPTTAPPEATPVATPPPAEVPVSLPFTGTNALPMFVGSLLAILFGFAMLVAGGEYRPEWALRLSSAGSGTLARRRRTGASSAPTPSRPVSAPPLRPVSLPVPSAVPVPAAPRVVPTPVVEALPVVEPVVEVVTIPVVEAPAAGWMLARDVVVGQLAQDWSSADRVATSAALASVARRLRRLEGVQGARAEAWRTRLEAERRRLNELPQV